MDVPLAVRLKTSRRDMDVTGEVRGLRFSSTVPGGFAACEISLSRPLDIQPDEIEYFATLYVYDSRNGRTIWEGRLEDPGRSSGDDGELWNITCVGPSAHAKDVTRPIIFVDTSLDRWARSKYSSGGALTGPNEIDDETASLQVRAAEGTATTTSWAGDYIYRSLYNAGQKIGRIRLDHIEEMVNTNLFVGILVRIGSGALIYSTVQSWDIVEDTIVAQVGAVGWNNASDIVAVRVFRSTTSVTANATTGAQIYNIVLRSLLMDVNGNDITDPAAYTGDNYVSTTEVVRDILGRWLTKFDGPNATIVGSGVDIHQLAYPDGISADELLSDLSIFDPAYYWAAWEGNPANNMRNRFEYKPWPTTVRYEATILDGFVSPGSAADLYNEVVVRWLDSHNRVRHTTQTQVIPELASAGLTRGFFIDISDEIGSKDSAIRVGTNFLAEHRYPPNAGTLTISRPIIDQDTGRMVMPWEILPGNLIRVTGVLPRVDSLNPTNRDGVSVFRIVTHEFNQDTASATLELDSYSRTVARALAQMNKRRFRKR